MVYTDASAKQEHVQTARKAMGRPVGLPTKQEPVVCDSVLVLAK